MNIEEITKKSPLTIQLATSAWQKPNTSYKEMDVILCEEFAKILYEEMKKPNLGNATTRELLNELKSRLENNEDVMEYKTTNY